LHKKFISRSSYCAADDSAQKGLVVDRCGCVLGGFPGVEHNAIPDRGHGADEAYGLCICTHLSRVGATQASRLAEPFLDLGSIVMCAR